jgi:hypothetical protein
MRDAYAILKRLREKAIAALDAANDATERATEVGERFGQAGSRRSRLPFWSV